MPAEQAIPRIIADTRAPASLMHPVEDKVPQHVRGLLAQADLMRPTPPVPSSQDPVYVQQIKVSAVERGTKLKTSPDVLEALTSAVKKTKTLGEVMSALQTVKGNMESTGAFSDIQFSLSPHDAVEGNAVSPNAADLQIFVKEKTVTGSVGTEYTASGHASFQAKAGISNLFGLAESISMDFAGAPTSFSLSDLSKMTEGSTNHMAIQPSFAFSFRKPTFMGSVRPFELKLRTFTERPDVTMGFSTKIREAELALSDSTLTHSLSYLSSWRNIIPLPDSSRLFGSASSSQVISDSAASFKSAAVYSFHKSTLSGGALPSAGSKLLFMAELAGLGGDVQHLKTQASLQVVKSFARYMPDTGYQSPLAKGLWSREQLGQLTEDEAAALRHERTALRPNPSNASLLTAAQLSAEVTPSDRAEDFLKGEKGVYLGHHHIHNRIASQAADYTLGSRIAGWLSAGATLMFDARVGSLVNYGETAHRAGGSHFCDRFYLTSLSMRGFESVGPKADRKVGGSPYGDALGGSTVAAVSARLLLPPPFPSVRLTNSGLRSQLFATAGVLDPHVGPLNTLHERVSASAGAGLVFPIAHGVTLEANYTLWHQQQNSDVASKLRFQIML